MTDARENISSNNTFGRLHMRRYDIAKNAFRAFFDDDDTLVFVIDDTVTGDKPNALLVIEPVGDRKWDDILSNDYGVALETIRPKKDNKYQKLDIEYDGLDVYDDLIQDFDDGVDIDDALTAFQEFRRDALQRAASARLTAATEAADAARQTVLRAQDTIEELDGRLKSLRAKLAKQRKDVGREPTKQSASKILRTESQIDIVRDKIKRAQRRLDNARRRLVAAEEDADIARGILAGHDGENIVKTESSSYVGAEIPARVAASDTPVFAPFPTQFDSDEDLDTDIDDIDEEPVAEQESVTKEETKSEPKAREMAEEEVKPLFDKDPNILDEEIAFKPIDFDVPRQSEAPTAAPQQPASSYAEPVAPAPLSFAPPSGGTNDYAAQPARYSDAPVSQMPAPDAVAPQLAPVLDSLTSTQPAAQQPYEQQYAPASAPSQYTNTPVDAVRPAPVYGQGPAPVQPAPVAQPTQTDAPGVTGQSARPVSPITGTPRSVPVKGANGSGGKPTVLYYVMLIMLIVISIFTLWLYQRKSGDTTPDLAGTTPAAEETQPTAESQGASPFIQIEDNEEVKIQEEAPTMIEPEPEPEPVVTPDPIPEPEPEPVIDESVPVTPVEVETSVPEELEGTPFITEPEPEPEPQLPPVINKPVYNAGSQSDEMFVADQDYDDGTDVTTVQIEDSTTPLDTGAGQPLCEDGTMPSADGCCAGEQYTDMGDGSFACCAGDGGDCFPPLF